MARRPCGAVVGNTEAADTYYASRTIPGTPLFTVDGFQRPRKACQHYFLTHFHSDHYAGLGPRWTSDVFCSPVTAKLVVQQLRVQPQYVRELPPVGESVVIAGVTVTTFDANHCPGAVMLHFKLSDGREIVHTGDFRYSPSMAAVPKLASCRPAFLFMDNTFCAPTYSFPSHDEVLAYVVKRLRPVIADAQTLIVVGTYTIGKERVLVGIAKEFGLKIYVTKAKYDIIRHLPLDLDFFSPMDTLALGSLATGATLIAAPMSALSVRSISQAIASGTLPFLRNAPLGLFKRIIGFCPTGWNMRSGPAGYQQRTTGPFEVHSVPYSEHSSFPELLEFVKLLRPEKIIPTVDEQAFRKQEASFRVAMSGDAPKASRPSVVRDIRNFVFWGRRNPNSAVASPKCHEEPAKPVGPPESPALSSSFASASASDDEPVEVLIVDSASEDESTVINLGPQGTVDLKAPSAAIVEQQRQLFHEILRTRSAGSIEASQPAAKRPKQEPRKLGPIGRFFGAVT